MFGTGERVTIYTYQEDRKQKTTWNDQHGSLPFLLGSQPFFFVIRVAGRGASYAVDQAIRTKKLAACHKI